MCVRVCIGLLNQSASVCDKMIRGVCQVNNLTVIYFHLWSLNYLFVFRSGPYLVKTFYSIPFQNVFFSFNLRSSNVPSCSELHTQSKVGTPTLRLEVKRKRFLLAEHVWGVHDLGSLGKLWLLFFAEGAWNRAGSCDTLVSLSLASRAISTRAAVAWAG